MNENKALSRFLSDIDCLQPLIERTSKLNIFDVLGISRTEIRHSNMLAWLMDPKENHGLGDTVLRGIMEHVSAEQIQDYRSFSIRREWNCIDLLAVSETEKILLSIENKVDTGEHDNQLARYKELVENSYPDYRKVFIYLTPAGKSSSDPVNWLAVGYSDILEIVESALDGKELSPEADLIIRNYADTIRRYVIRDDSIRKICEEIYQKHQNALEQIWGKTGQPDEQKIIEEISLQYQAVLDLIWKYRPRKGTDRIAETIHTWAKQRTDEGKIEVDLTNTSDATTRFKTKYMSELLPDLDDNISAWRTSNIYFYEIRNQAFDTEHELYIQLAIGSQNISDDMRATCDRINAVFPANRKKEDWVYRINYSTKHVIFSEDADPEDLINQLDEFLNNIFAFEDELAERIENIKEI